MHVTIISLCCWSNKKYDPQDDIVMDSEDAPYVQDDTMMIGGEKITIDTSEDPFTSTIYDPSVGKKDHEVCNLETIHIVDYKS